MTPDQPTRVGHGGPASPAGNDKVVRRDGKHRSLLSAFPSLGRSSLLVRWRWGRPVSSLPRGGVIVVARRRKVRWGPEILRTWLARCETCKLLSGHLHEKHNGLVPVYCPCQRELLSGGRWANPSMLSLRDDRAIWYPISDHMGPDGKKWHQPWFAGLSLDQEGRGFSLVVERGPIRP